MCFNHSYANRPLCAFGRQTWTPRLFGNRVPRRGINTNALDKNEYFEKEIFQQRNHLPISLYTKVANIPPEGYTLTEIERSCDRNEKFCKTPLHVWECECPVCHGTGNVSYDRPKKTRILSVCPVCSGLGVVRYISADVEGEDFSQFKTLLRKSNGIM